MSLDVTLKIDGAIKKSSSGIFVRRNGQTVEISEAEWYEQNPGRRPFRLDGENVVTNVAYSSNITHNLNSMAEEAGIYKELWRPEEIGIAEAKDLIEPLRNGLHRLKLDPERFKKFNPKNGWGNYEGLVKFVENYLNACYEFPDAKIEVCR
jgi:hypothetical protein